VSHLLSASDFPSSQPQESTGSTQNRELSAKGAEIRPYDVSSGDAVFGLKGIDVLICTIGARGLRLQPKLIEAAHAAGVKLLVPAEFGDTTEDRPEPLFALKAAAHTQAAKLGLPTVAVFCGPWTDFFVYYGFDLAAGKITINGQGDAKVSTTSIADVAYFVAYVLTELPKDKLENAKFTLEGDVVVRIRSILYLSNPLTLIQTFNSLAISLQEVSSKPIEIIHIPRSAVEARLKANPDDFLAALSLGWDSGKALHQHPNSHALIPGWEPKKALEVLRPLLSQDPE
jgi:uncharacterized protein YbjT (DUF2867 family)